MRYSIALVWRVGREESRTKAVIICFMDMEKKGLKGDKIYLDDCLRHERKENGLYIEMVRSLSNRRQACDNVWLIRPYA